MANYVVGLTGGIGSGKSEAARCFARLGVTVVDTDLIAHQMTAPGGAAMPAIGEAFGADVVAQDGSLDRAAMRRIVFSDAGARRRLEAILHPMIRAEADSACALAAGPYCVLAVPLLVESGGYRERCQRILVVDCEPETQTRRVMARGGLAHEEVRAIMAAQIARAARLEAADDVIRNEGALDELAAEVGRLHSQYRVLAEKT